jgi:hypothetical protein
MFRLLADFNEVRDDRVRGLVESLVGTGSVVAGDRILVHDGGEEAAGTVERIENGLIYVLVDWSTFGPTRRTHYDRKWWAATLREVMPMEDEQLTGLCGVTYRWNDDPAKADEPVNA